MAIKMVREPSETPNIRNIDDIIGLRYAYGNQDGYVIGKGNEISHTINGSNFTINSGRIVIQGVECDIDANGVTIQVDNIASLRYYTIYCEVNLATNTTRIASVNDTAGYPPVDKGDDLTSISSGIARVELYHFQAQNGVISDVEKLIKGIKYINEEYIKNIKVNNAENADNANTANIATEANVASLIKNQKNGNESFKLWASPYGGVSLISSDVNEYGKYQYLCTYADMDTFTLKGGESKQFLANSIYNYVATYFLIDLEIVDNSGIPTRTYKDILLYPNRTTQFTFERGILTITVNIVRTDDIGHFKVTLSSSSISGASSYTLYVHSAKAIII